MKSRVEFVGQAKKAIRKGFDLKTKLNNLVKDLEDRGAIQPKWNRFSKLKDGSGYHCHLGYRHVACWRLSADSIELYFIGRRNNAPWNADKR